jgi:exopolysaccharide biosynthesis polyprenyl glycosylphosphotransferase
MKRSEVFINIAKVFVDIVMIMIGFVVAYEVRLHASDFVAIKWVPPLSNYLKFLILFVPVWLSVFAGIGLYNFKGVGSLVKEMWLSIVGVSTVLSLMIIIIFFNQDTFFSRLIIIYALFFVSLFVIFGRVLIRLMQRYFYRYGIGVRRVLLVGVNNQTEELRQYFDTYKNMGWDLVGLLDETKQKGEKVGSYRILGNMEKLPKIYKRYGINEIWLTGETDDDYQMQIINFCQKKDLVYRFIPGILGVVSANVETETVAGMPLIALKETALEGWGRIIKRILDIILSIIVITFLWWLFLIIGIMIKLESKGPVFYSSERVGRKGKLFTIYKFRSMVVDADKMKKKLLEKNEAEGPMFKIKNDPRITKVGNFIRKTRIDELPQVWNVLMGEMSWIGPRPPLMDEVKQYKAHHLKRLAIKSGITGPWQVTGRHDLDFDDIVKLDTYYIENWSLLLDAQIFFKTIWLMLTRAGR